MPFHAFPWRGRGSSVPARSLVGAPLLVACGLAMAPPAPAAAQYLIYERPYVYERPPVYAPPPRGPLQYVMLPPAEVRRRLQNMGYWQISRPELSGRTYVLTAVDNEGPVSLRLDAYSGEVLAARPLSALPPGAGRPPLVPPATVNAAPAQPPRMAPSAPLPPVRPPEADLALAAPPPPPASPHDAATGAAGGAVPAVAAPSASVPAAPAASAPVAVPSPGPSPGPAPAPVLEVAGPAGAGSATPGGGAAGSASVLSAPAGTE